jgi:hypothetical protein
MPFEIRFPCLTFYNLVILPRENIAKINYKEWGKYSIYSLLFRTGLNSSKNYPILFLVRMGFV